MQFNTFTIFYWNIMKIQRVHYSLGCNHVYIIVYLTFTLFIVCLCRIQHTTINFRIHLGHAQFPMYFKMIYSEFEQSKIRISYLAVSRLKSINRFHLLKLLHIISKTILLSPLNNGAFVVHRFIWRQLKFNHKLLQLEMKIVQIFCLIFMILRAKCGLVPRSAREISPSHFEDHKIKEVTVTTEANVKKQTDFNIEGTTLKEISSNESLNSPTDADRCPKGFEVSEDGLCELSFDAGTDTSRGNSRANFGAGCLKGYARAEDGTCQEIIYD